MPSESLDSFNNIEPAVQVMMLAVIPLTIILIVGILSWLTYHSRKMRRRQLPDDVMLAVAKDGDFFQITIHKDTQFHQESIAHLLEDYENSDTKAITKDDDPMVDT